jgi:hypothetical protein
MLLNTQSTLPILSLFGLNGALFCSVLPLEDLFSVLPVKRMSTLLKWLLESLFVLNALEVLSGWSLEAS